MTSLEAHLQVMNDLEKAYSDHQISNPHIFQFWSRVFIGISLPMQALNSFIICNKNFNNHTWYTCIQKHSYCVKIL